MHDPSPEGCARRFELVFDLAEAGILMMRENLARRFPADTAEAREARLRDWLAQPHDERIFRERPVPR
ncbi:MAG: hypothetical protein H6702_14285 [Myxococcales bacterium]|nr:hypothetical protein [Myxococcales bacterium]